ncbi:hypothetical protein BJ165DRAFT_1531993 [Panaeolus papilionaceus]|nr:hypothetical protein BJ165DRAFT_1531993 [Panaeolus papilionaceus]
MSSSRIDVMNFEHHDASTTVLPASNQSIRVDIGDAEPSCRRSLGKVVWSCLATIFAYTWVAVHPNIALERESGWVVVWRRAGLMISMILVPEMVVCWALRQFVLASYIGEKYKDLGWTRTHAFFLIMGGFSYMGPNGCEVLTYRKMIDLDLQSRIGGLVSAKQIEDRSKADWLAKAIVLVQTFWFCMQLFTRLGQHLVVTELEISTLAFAVLNFVVYVLWWDKPFDVRSQIFIPVPSRQDDNSTEVLQVEHLQSKPLIEVTARKYLAKKWNHAKGSFASTSLDEPLDFLTFLPSVMFGLFVSPFSDLFVEYSVSTANSKRAYEDDKSTCQDNHCWFMRQLFNPWTQWALVSAIAVVFGGVHLIAWPFRFPSDTEKWLWRGSAIALVAPAISFQAIQLARAYGGKPRSSVPGVIMVISMICAQLTGIAYFLARFIILILPFTSLRKLAPGALTEINWAALIPHF